MIKWLTSSFGFKRLITSVLLVLIGIAQTNPALQPHLPAIDALLGGLGGVSLAHAYKAGTLATLKSGSIAALFTVIMAIAGTNPAMLPFLPFLHIIGVTLGGIGVGEALGKADMSNDRAPTAKMVKEAEEVTVKVPVEPVVTVSHVIDPVTTVPKD